MSEGFLGTGVRFDITGDPPEIGLDARGFLAEARDEEAIRQSIWLILGTAPGERVGREDFGCGIHDLVFATPSDGTVGDIVTAVEDALARWEPRIDVLSVDATPEDDALIIEIQYEVRATNSRQNLVYPFYLST